ncbi:MAG: Cna B-type domain-containing protein [Peptoniphilus lacydonensis]|uniref:Cna B-type domain-containing protein n=1 Tax=Peptoniphilus lacydonensis TaxID=1673725 RepID=UPI0025902423|nr:Cna B-type domain-containing protein [Peptoniphilus lacydonensis]MDU7302201.1 Cna B-type domain-containing protein [Peptoniphilus lacydonensis]
MLRNKKLMAFFLACLMLLSTFVPIGEIFAQAANELTKTKISRMEVKDQDGNTIDLNDDIAEEKNCKLEFDWDSSEYKENIKAGDYFNVNLPKNFKTLENDFTVNTIDGVQVAKAQVNNSNSEVGGGTLKVVFTSLVENKTDVAGSIAIEGSLLNTNNPPEERELEIKEDEASTEKVMNAENNENDNNNENNEDNEVNGSCSNIDLSLDIESSDKTEYHGTDIIQSRVVIDGKGLKGEVKGLYYDVIFPSEEFPIRGDRNWDPIDVTRWEDPNNQGKYIDSTATIQNYPMIDKVEKRVEDGKTIYRVYLKAIDSTTTLKIPYSFSFKDNITPPDYKFQPEVKLYDASGCLIKEAKDKEYSIKYDGFKARKLVNLSSAKDQMNFGGHPDEKRPGRISEYQTKPVTFQFNFDAIDGGYRGTNARALKSYVITDTLPTYKGANGKERTAEFRAEENPGWVLSADGKTVTYNLNERKRHSNNDGEFLNDGAAGDLYEEGVQLKLRFPGAKTNSQDTPDEDRIYYDNNVDIEAKPYNPSKGEVYKASANLSFQLTSDPLDGKGIFWKNNEYDAGILYPESPAKTYYDPSGMASAEVNYSVFLENKTPEPMKNIVIIEDAKSFDPRFYVSGIFIPEQTKPNKKNLDSSQYEIRGIKSDGTYDIITEKLFNYTEHPINKLAQEEAKNIRSQVLDGKIDRENAPAVNPEYDKVEIHLKNYELPVGAQLKLRVRMKYKDPFKVKFEPDRALNNTAEVMFKSGDDEYAFTSSADKYLIPIEESVKLDKRTDYKGNSTPKVGDKVRFDINYDFRGLSNQRELSNLTFVDLLPEGITVSSNPKELGLWLSNGDIKYKYEIVKNYNNTGKDALVLKIDNFLVGDYETANGKILRIRFDGKINENIVPEKAITDKINNDNIVYSYFNDDQSVLNPKVGDPLSSTVVVDKLDINNNGKTHDSILMAKSDVKSILAQSVKSIKRIRSVEPVEENGDLVYDRAFSLDTVTNYADKANDKLGRFEYQLRVNNYIEEPLKNLEIYDILPSFVDGNNKYRNKLVDEIKIYKAGKDVTSDFTVFYTTDGNPSDDPVKAVKNQNWVKNPTSYEDVTAIKIKSNINPVLENYETLDIRLQMKAPEYPGNNNLNDKVATNSFFVRYAEDGNFGESNSVTNGLIKKEDIKVEKIWQDKDGKVIDAPTGKIEVELYKDEQATGKKLELDKSNNWKAEFKNLELEDKSDIYTIKEVGEKDGSIKFGDKWYDVSYTRTKEDGFKITNKEPNPLTPLDPPKTDVKVEKIWQDKDGKEISAPVEKIEVELYRDGKATGEKKELSKENNWSGEFKDLDVVEKLDSKKAYKYTVKEVGEKDCKITIGDKKYQVSYDGNEEKGLTIKNKLEEKSDPWTPITPSKEDIKVEKVWQNKNGKVIEAPVDKIEVELYRDGKATGEKKELTKDNKWTAEFKDLDVVESLDSKNYYKYTVKEVGEDTGSIKINGNWYKVNYSGSMEDGFAITNQEEPKSPPRPRPSEPNTIDIKVKKDWILYGNKPVDKIVVELYRDGEATGKLLDLNKDNNWSGEFKDLDAKKSSNSTHDYHYTIKEVGEAGNTIKLDGKWFDVNYLGSAEDGFTIVNKEEKPTRPDRSEDPKKPEKPDTPNKLDNPEEPENPNTPEEPNEVETPDKPNTSKTPSQGKELPKTGDGLNLSTYAWILLGLGNLSTFAGIQRKKKLNSRRKKNVK